MAFKIGICYEVKKSSTDGIIQHREITLCIEIPYHQKSRKDGITQHRVEPYVLKFPTIKSPERTA